MFSKTINFSDNYLVCDRDCAKFDLLKKKRERKPRTRKRQHSATKQTPLPEQPIRNKSHPHIYGTKQTRFCYLFSGQQGDGRHAVGVLVALRHRHLLEEIHLLLAGEEEDLGVAEHHDGVRQLVAEQPCLRTERRGET